MKLVLVIVCNVSSADASVAGKFIVYDSEVPEVGVKLLCILTSILEFSIATSKSSITLNMLDLLNTFPNFCKLEEKKLFMVVCTLSSTAFAVNVAL